MTFKYENVYVNETSTVAGPIENKGPIANYFDKTYTDYYFGVKGIEQAEVKLFNESVDILLKKTKTIKEGIDLLIAGDLSNQIAISCYGVSKYKIPFLGVYSACATTMESIIMGSSLIDNKKINNCICTTTSHNLVSEKQFRNPIEYGAPKPLTATFTATGGASVLISNKKSDIKVTSSTIGKIINLNYKDVNNMGAVMAPAAADTIFWHLKNNNEDISSYDLILTGDLGIYGKAILKDYINKEYKINLDNNYDDCGCILYDINKQKEITAGGSGPVCSALVNYGYIFNLMKKKKYNKVLLVTTGALFSPTFLYQKESILGIAHAVCFESNEIGGGK